MHMCVKKKIEEKVTPFAKCKKCKYLFFKLIKSYTIYKKKGADKNSYSEIYVAMRHSILS